MTVRMEQGVIFLEGHCPSGDADELLQNLLSYPGAYVVWRTCESAHTAVIQVLLAARREVRGPPHSAFLASVASALTRKRV